MWSREPSSQGFLFSIESDLNMAEIAHRLYDDYNIECRYGFHCAILAHNFYNNNNGAIRFSFSPYTTKEDLEYLADVLINKL
nr:aminotransferase class V-fold PLP-dependent enzyme [Brachyspira pilosicoli]